MIKTYPMPRVPPVTRAVIPPRDHLPSCLGPAMVPAFGSELVMGRKEVGLRESWRWGQRGSEGGGGGECGPSV